MLISLGSNPSQGTLLRASQFLAGTLHFLFRMELTCLEELPVRLAHRVKDLEHLPDKLHEMQSIQKVKNWYAQSFEVYSLQCSSVIVRN
jgi:pyruvate dehydrogenase kinase 2/3/4